MKWKKTHSWPLKTFFMWVRGAIESFLGEDLSIFGEAVGWIHLSVYRVGAIVDVGGGSLSQHHGVSCSLAVICMSPSTWTQLLPQDLSIADICWLVTMICLYFRPFHLLCLSSHIERQSLVECDWVVTTLLNCHECPVWPFWDKALRKEIWMFAK